MIVTFRQVKSTGHQKLLKQSSFLPNLSNEFPANTMKTISITFYILIVLCIPACTQPQAPQESRPVGDGCEGCEAIFEYGNKVLAATDTLPDFHESGPKMIVTGTIYQRDGKTPAKDVILYIYHTDQKGHYATRGNEKGWAKRHGYIRGWIKTAADGKYTFYTLKPAPYPGENIPAHIHPVIKEPGIQEYWIDEYLFQDDPLLSPAERNQQQKRGGNGIVTLTRNKQGILICQRDIILGKNIPGY
jgi:protocatechuate 3,4-dioxygenase, beta subunit